MSPEEFATVNRAEAWLTGACMKRFGVQWKAPSAAEQRDTVAMYSKSLLSAEADEARARQHGFRIPPDSPVSRMREKPHDDPVSPEAAKVLSGTVKAHNGRPVPQGGCNGEANRKLRGEAESDIAEGSPGSPEGIRLEAIERASADPDMTKARNEYAACMKAKGYDYDSPFEASEDKRWAGDGPPSREEINTAVADVRCREQVGYLKTVAKLRAKYQKQMIEKNAERLQAHKSLLDAMVRRASQILSGETPQ